MKKIEKPEFSHSSPPPKPRVGQRDGDEEEDEEEKRASQGQRPKRERRQNCNSATLCQVCNIQLNSRAQAQIHYRGKTHQRKLRRLAKAVSTGRDAAILCTYFCRKVWFNVSHWCAVKVVSSSNDWIPQKHSSFILIYLVDFCNYLLLYYGLHLPTSIQGLSVYLYMQQCGCGCSLRITFEILSSTSLATLTIRLQQSPLQCYSKGATWER